MSASTEPVVVGVDGSSGSELALRWALDDATVRNAPVQVICCHRRPATLGWEGIHQSDSEQLGSAAEEFAHEVVAKALEQARAIAPDLEITGEAVHGAAAEVLADRSAGAARVVVGSRQLKALGSALLGSVGTGLAARAQSPVVVVRGPAGLAAERPAVVVGIDGTDAVEPALAFAFEHASRHAVPLRAVMCWRPDPLAAMQWRPEAPVPERAQHWLSETVAAWQQQYPDVPAAAAVIRDHPVAGLVAQSAAEHLLVVRSRARSALAGSLLGSVTQGVLHHATCPVAVIPAAVP
jgi:nucleotide-binding universal stress UspA family protein